MKNIIIFRITVATHMWDFIDINEDLVNRFLRELYIDDNISGAHNTEDEFKYYILRIEKVEQKFHGVIRENKRIRETLFPKFGRNARCNIG